MSVGRGSERQIRQRENCSSLHASHRVQVEGTLPHYQIVLTREADLDQMEVQVEVTREVFGDTVGALEQVQQKLGKSIDNMIGLRATVRLVQPQTLQRSEGKAKRVIDQRKM